MGFTSANTELTQGEHHLLPIGEVSCLLPSTRWSSRHKGCVMNLRFDDNGKVRHMYLLKTSRGNNDEPYIVNIDVIKDIPHVFKRDIPRSNHAGETA